MFTKKDYLKYFDELYDVEMFMKKEGEKLLKIVKDPRAQEMIKALIDDEIRHAKIVKSMKELI